MFVKEGSGCAGGNMKKCEMDGKKESVYVRIGKAKKGEREECMCVCVVVG